MAIVWPCSLDVDAYAAAGRDVDVARPHCPGCGEAMILWSGYLRYVRQRVDHGIWIRRARCGPCRVSHALLPAFCLLGRLDSVEVIGPALAASLAGAGDRPIAEAATGLCKMGARYYQPELGRWTQPDPSG